VPFIILVIVLISFLVLVRTFRSIVLAIKAIILGLISIAVSFAVLVLIFRFGVGTYQLEQLEAWVLILLFAILFGLSMDYEIFIVSRMREAWDRGVSNEEAIREGMRNSGTVVTAAALIFIAALTGLITGHFAGLQQLGIGLAAGVLIDATIIRGLLLPSAMVLLGKWNWWLPGQGKTPPLT
jgi:RND superfamily putative drug exporter